MNPIALREIEAAASRIKGSALRTPLLRLPMEDAPAQIYLKLENLQPIGSFKLRGAGNAMASAAPEQLTGGVVTASAGNMAQGVAWNARRLGIACHVVAPDHAPETKLDAIRRLGGEIVKAPFDEWWGVILSGRYEALPGAVYPSREQPRCHCRQWHNRPGDPGGFARCRCGDHPPMAAAG